jgi:hypothetical protein
MNRLNGAVRGGRNVRPTSLMTKPAKVSGSTQRGMRWTMLTIQNTRTGCTTSRPMMTGRSGSSSPGRRPLISE